MRAAEDQRAQEEAIVTGWRMRASSHGRDAACLGP
jgi:hypothetical protein